MANPFNIDLTGKNIVITIAREYGSGGRYLGKLIAEKLEIKLYDKELIEQKKDLSVSAMRGG